MATAGKGPLKGITARRLASNAGLSVLQVLVSGVLLFFVYRHLLKQLGAEQLGLWSVLLASTSVARLSDLGMTSGVVKFVARYRARQDEASASEVVQTTATTIALGMGLVLLALYPLLLRVLDWSIPPATLAQAKSILPWAVLALWLSAIAGVFQAALDGCQQAGVRNILTMAGNVLFFACVVFFVPPFGLEALAYSQVAQSLLLLVSNWVLLRFFMKKLPVVPWRWSKMRFKEMFSYSLNFQLAMAAIMLCDPATKLLMGRFGGLGAAAYYEMATQLVVRARSLLVSANQVLVPVVAELHESAPERLRETYMRAYDAVFFLALPAYTGLLLLLPLVSQIWIGHVEPQFMVFASLLIASYFLNNLEVPAYFDNLGTGHLGWNTISHVSMAAMNAALCAWWGWQFGANGVAAGAAVSLVIASAMVLFAVNHKYKVPWPQLFPVDHRGLALTVVCATVIGLAWLAWTQDRGYSVAMATGVLIPLFIGVWLIAGRRHPYLGELQRLYRSRVGAAS
jgi:O-antigen/teichoic acid export membrane protein